MHLKIEQQKLPNLHNRKQTEKISKASEICKTIAKDLAFKSSEDEKKKYGTEKVLEELIVENALNLAKRKSKIQEAEQIPNRIKPKKFTLRHNIINLAKTKEKILKSKRKEALSTMEKQFQ